MITSTQITNTEIFVFIDVLVFKLFSHKILFMNKKRQKKLLKRPTDSPTTYHLTHQLTDHLPSNPPADYH